MIRKCGDDFLEENAFLNLKSSLAKSFCNMSDISVRELDFGKTRFYLYYISNHSSKLLINKFIIAPLSEYYLRGGADSHISGIITGNSLKTATDAAEAQNAVLSGNCLIIFKDMPNDICGYICATRNDEGRGNDEPETENVIRGPHDGFNESSEQNVMLLRRRIKSTHLKSEKMCVGTITKTDIVIMYLDNIVNEKALCILRRRLSAINASAVIDSGYVEAYIQDKGYSLYPTVGNSERPDKVAGKLLEGRIAVIVDGSPVVLTVPYLFCEGFQVSEDYSKSSFFATFVRGLRFSALIFALYLPSLFTALVMHHSSFLPQEMQDYMAQTREGMTVSLVWEVVTAFLIFEVLREVGLRMPKAVGSAVGIVGSLILGDSAVSAGIISPFVLIIVAFSAVCNFIAVPYMNPNGIYRLVLIIISGIFGLFGHFAFTAVSLVVGCRKTSFGVPYFSPFAPISVGELSDLIYMAPVWKNKNVPPSVSGRKEKRTEGKKPQ